AAIKGCGWQATDSIVEARKTGGPFKDLFDFCDRADSRLVNKAAIERLIKAGAFDGLRGHRAQLTQLLPRALQSAADRQNDIRKGQKSLFGGNGDDVPAPAVAEDLPEVAP